MQDHIAQKVKWRYLINVAGQAFPLRTPEEMVDVLRIYNGSNDIEGIYKRRIFRRYKRVTNAFQYFNISDHSPRTVCFMLTAHVEQK